MALELENTYRIDDVITESESDVRIATYSDGSFAAIWSVNGTANTSLLYYRKYNADGIPVTDDRTIMIDWVAPYGKPTLLNATTLADGHIYVTYLANEAGSTSNLAVYGQLFDANMTALTNNPTLISNDYYTSTTFNTEPEVVSLSGGGFITSWYEGNLTTGEIYIQGFNASGIQVLGKTQLSTNFVSAKDTSFASIAGNKFVLSYSDGHDVFHNIYQLNGSQLTTVAAGIHAEGFTAFNQDNVQVSGLENGGFVVVWESTDGPVSTNTGIYQKVFDANGNPVAFGTTAINEDNLVNNTTVGNQTNPEVTGLDNGGWVVSWNDSNSPAHLNVKVYDSDGYSIGEETLVASSTARTDVTALKDGSFVVTWSNGSTEYERVIHLHGSTINGDASNNVIYGTSLEDTINGGAGNDVIYGYNHSGNIHDRGDFIDGGQGSDTMYGGLGDDTYVIDTLPANGVGGDVVMELAGQGTDTINTSVSFSLANALNVENIKLTGDQDLNATGNALNNFIIGNAGANIIDGGAGGDQMNGWGGDDTYFIDSVDDVVGEVVNGGTADKIKVSIGAVNLSNEKYANVENATLLGSDDFALGGSAFDNNLIGNSGNNKLIGREGNDVLYGEAGTDTFVFKAGWNKDAIADFDLNGEKIDLTSFTAIHSKSDLNISANANGFAVIDFGNGDTLTLRQIDYHDLVNNDFIFA